MKVAIRVDSSAQMGSGHLMRCLTLAGELQRRGATVLFLSREHAGNLISRIDAEGYAAARLNAPTTTQATAEDYAAWVGASQEEDAREVRAHLHAPVDWLIVDHYGLDHAWERAMRPVAGRILVIDDLATRRHDCDALLDQNYFGTASDTRYAQLVDRNCLQMLGPQFALLQPDYRAVRRSLPPRDGTVRRLLVYFGGSDTAGDGPKVLEALSCTTLRHLAVDVVVGHEQPNRHAVQQWIDGRSDATLHSGLPSLAVLMARADLAVGGGGTTTWERACLALPAAIVTVARNQETLSQALSDGGYQVLLGGNADTSVQNWRDTLIQLIADTDRLAELSRRAASLTDGDGTARVAATLFDRAERARSPRNGSTRPTVLLTGAGGAAVPTLIEHLRARGYRVVAVDADPNAAGLYFADSGYQIPLARDSAFAPTLQRICRAEEVRVIVPLVDEELLLAGRLADEIGIAILTPQSEFIAATLDKHVLMQRLAGAGLPVPESRLLSAGVGGMRFPLIVKPRVGRGSRGIKVVHSRAELDAHIAAASPDGDSTLVQSYVQGTEFTVSVVVWRDGEVRAVVPKEIVDKRGITRIAVTRRNSAIDELCRAIQRQMHANGPFNVQLRLDAGSGTPMTFEINPRFSTTVTLTQAAGVDELGALVDLSLGRSVSPGEWQWREGVTLVRRTAESFMTFGTYAERRGALKQGSS